MTYLTLSKWFTLCNIQKFNPLSLQEDASFRLLVRDTSVHFAQYEKYGRHENKTEIRDNQKNNCCGDILI
jgi:hypothetical protein